MDSDLLFSNVKFYLISSNDSQLNSILQSHGASQQFYLSERVTFAISDDPTAAEVGEAQDLHAVSVVTSKWVHMSLEVKKQLPFAPFHPHFAFTFSNVTATLTEMSLSDRKWVSAILQIRGGIVKQSLDHTITHLITGKADGFLYKSVKDNKLDEQQLCCVTPDWVMDSANVGHLLPDEDYDPAFLRPPTPPPPPPPPPPQPPVQVSQPIIQQVNKPNTQQIKVPEPLTKQKVSGATADSGGIKAMRQPVTTSVPQKSMQKSNPQLQAAMSMSMSPMPESLSSPPIITGTPANMAVSQNISDNMQMMQQQQGVRMTTAQQAQNMKNPALNNPRFISAPNAAPPGQQMQQPQQQRLFVGNRPQGIHATPQTQQNLGIRQQQRQMQPGMHQQMSAGQQGMNNFSPLSLPPPMQQMPGVVSPNFANQLSVSMPSSNASGGQSSLNSSGNSGTGSATGSKSKTKSSKHAQEQALNEEEKDAIVMQNVKNILSQQHNWNKEQHVKQGGNQLSSSSGIVSNVSMAQKKPKSPKSSPSRSKSPKSPKTTKPKLSQQQQLIAAQQQTMFQPHQVVTQSGPANTSTGIAPIGQPRQLNIVPQTTSNMVSPSSVPAPRASVTSTTTANNLGVKAIQSSNQLAAPPQKLVSPQQPTGQNVVIQQSQQQLQQKAQPMKKPQPTIHHPSIPLMSQPALQSLGNLQQQVTKQAPPQQGQQMQSQTSRQLSAPVNLQLDPGHSSVPQQVLHQMHSNQQQQQVLHTAVGGNLLTSINQSHHQQPGSVTAQTALLQQSHLQHGQQISLTQGQQASVQWSTGPAPQQHLYQSGQNAVAIHPHHPSQQQQQSAQFATNPNVHQIARPQMMSGAAAHLTGQQRPGMNQSPQFVIQTASMPPGAQIRAATAGMESQAQVAAQGQIHPGQGHQLTMRLSQSGATVFTATQPSQQPVAIMQQDILHTNLNRMHENGPPGHSPTIIQQHQNAALLSGSNGPGLVNNSHLPVGNQGQHPANNPNISVPQLSGGQVSNMAGLASQMSGNATPSVQSFSGLVNNQDANAINQQSTGQLQSNIPSTTGSTPTSSGNVVTPAPRIPHYVAYENDRGPKSKKECLVGCVFHILGYTKTPNQEKRVWISVMRSYGAEILPVYDADRVTHILLDTTLVEPDFFKQALFSDKKRIVTIFWVNDCLENKTMEPPNQILHLPSPFSKSLSLNYIRKQIISITGFEVETPRMQALIEQTGAHFTPYLDVTNTVLICKKPTGKKYEMAQRWNIACVNVRWLQDLYFGDLRTLSKDIDHKYLTFEEKDTTLALDKTSPPVQEFMIGWLTPIKLSKDVWTRHQDLQTKFFEEEASRKRKAETALANEPKSKRACTLSPLTDAELSLAMSCPLREIKVEIKSEIPENPIARDMDLKNPSTETTSISAPSAKDQNEIDNPEKMETANVIEEANSMQISNQVLASENVDTKTQDEVQTVIMESDTTMALETNHPQEEAHTEMGEKNPVVPPTEEDSTKPPEFAVTTEPTGESIDPSIQEHLPMEVEPEKVAVTSVECKEEPVLSTASFEEPMQVDQESAETFDSANIIQQATLTTVEDNAATLPVQEEIKIKEEIIESHPVEEPEQSHVTVSVREEESSNVVESVSAKAEGIKTEALDPATSSLSPNLNQATNDLDDDENATKKESDEPLISIETQSTIQSQKLEDNATEPSAPTESIASLNPPSVPIEASTPLESSVPMESSTSLEPSAPVDQSAPTEPSTSSESSALGESSTPVEPSAPEADSNAQTKDQNNTIVNDNSNSMILNTPAAVQNVNSHPAGLDAIKSTPEIQVKEMVSESVIAMPLENKDRVKNNSPRLSYTGLTLDEKNNLMEMVGELGGCMVESVKDCTHLITNKIIRTPKFYYAIVHGKEIMSPKWIQASLHRGAWLDESFWVLEDKLSESQLGFSLADSLMRSRARIAQNQPGLFDTLEFWLSPGAKHRDICIELIKACGGIVRDRRPTQKMALLTEPKQLVICHENDSHLATYLMRTKTGNRAVHHEEFVLSGIMRQEVDYETYQIQYVVGVNSEIAAAANSIASSPQHKQIAQTAVGKTINVQSNFLQPSQITIPIKSTITSVSNSTGDIAVPAVTKSSQPITDSKSEKTEEPMDTSLIETENSAVTPQASSSPKSPTSNVVSHTS